MEKFADQMRIERNTYLLEKEELEEQIKDLIQQYYFDMRNKQVEIETLKNKELQLQNKQENLISLSEGILRSIEEKLSNHDGYALNELKQKLKKIDTEYQDNNDEIKRLFTLQQKKILHKRLISKLGGEKKVNIKISSGPILDKPGDLAGILTNYENHDFFFIDEI